MDKPYEELHVWLNQILDSGGTFWGKFTCGHCGARQTFEEPNVLFAAGKCEECEQTTLLNKWGVVVLLTKESLP